MEWVLRDGPVYLMIGGLVVFMIYVFVHSNRKDDQDKKSLDGKK